MTAAELPIGDELVLNLDGYDDDRLAAYVRGLLEHFELKASSLDPYDATTLSDFSDMMVQDVHRRRERRQRLAPDPVRLPRHRRRRER
jgi:hypothetical protein